MRLRAALNHLARNAVRPRLIIPAALVLLLVPVVPASVGHAAPRGVSNTGFGMSGVNPERMHRFSVQSTNPRAVEKRWPTGSNTTSNLPKMGYPNQRPRPTGTANIPTTKNYPNRPSKNYPNRPRPTETTQRPRPTGIAGYPKRPTTIPRPVIPRPTGTFAGRPGGSGVPPVGVAPAGAAAGGGGQPPAQFARRPGSGIPPVNERRYVPNEVLVEVAANVPQPAIDAMVRRHGLTTLQSTRVELTGTTFVRLQIRGRRTVPQALRALQGESIAMWVQPNYVAMLGEAAPSPASLPAVFPADLEQYSLARMRMQEAHQLASGNHVLVAVIDGGADTRHPELQGLVVDRFDAIGSGDAAHPHGTSILGAIAARARLRGTAPGAHILLARAFGVSRGNNEGTSVHIIRSVDWAVARGARIINMSFTGARDPAIERLLASARQRNVVLVAAAGNAGSSSAPLYPAALAGVIAVTATDENDRIFRAANRGSHITVAAPGVDLWLPTVNQGYRITSGTSFAAAEVSGLIALMLERNPGLDPDAVLRALVATARSLGARAEFGAGLVDAYAAILSVDPGSASAAEPAATTGAGNR